MTTKKRVFTGTKPTAAMLHIGNYFGMMKPVLDYQAQGVDVLFYLAVMHTLTEFHDAEAIRKNTIEFVKQFVACGVDPSKVTIFSGTDIPGHAQLHWILSCITSMGMMERMHAFKDSVAKKKSGEVSVGTFCYPILQAADVLLYNAHDVPVGRDQKQHIEFARDIAQKFNRIFGDTFVVPHPVINETVAVVPGIDGRKMSKSYNNFIGLLDDDKTLHKKVMMISTDAKAIEEPKDPTTCNLFAIIKLFMSQEEQDNLASRYLAGGLSYKEVKEDLYERLIKFISPIRENYAKISDDEVKKILSDSKSRLIGETTEFIEKIYKAVGFTL